jgi:segregation and condensation protein A
MCYARAESHGDARDRGGSRVAARKEHEALAFEQDEVSAGGEDGSAFVVDVDGFEGPLDLLLDLARRQKVDLCKISVLALAEQYLEFIEAARHLRLELAGDYLVMAAWLAFLKSRLLLPRAETDEAVPPAAELAEALQARLRRLEAIRAAAEALDSRPRLGREIFARGRTESIMEEAAPEWRASLYELLSAYTARRQKQARTHVTVKQRTVWSLARARTELERFAGQAIDWTLLDPYLLDFCTSPDLRRTVRASTLSASLEMVKEGAITMRQEEHFGPLSIKRRPQPRLVVG